LKNLETITKREKFMTQYVIFLSDVLMGKILNIKALLDPKTIRTHSHWLPLRCKITTVKLGYNEHSVITNTRL
jgi:hypothetical protein